MADALTRYDVAQALLRLRRVLVKPREMPDDASVVIEEYWAVLSRFAPATLTAACDVAIERETFVPVPAILRSYAFEHLDSVGPRAARTPSWREADLRAQEDRYHAALARATRAWAAEHADLAEALRERVDGDLSLAPAGPFGDLVREARLLQLIAAEIDFPDCAAWTTPNECPHDA